MYFVPVPRRAVAPSPRRLPNQSQLFALFPRVPRLPFSVFRFPLSPRACGWILFVRPGPSGSHTCLCQLHLLVLAPCLTAPYCFPIGQSSVSVSYAVPVSRSLEVLTHCSTWSHSRFGISGGSVPLCPTLSAVSAQTASGPASALMAPASFHLAG